MSSLACVLHELSVEIDLGRCNLFPFCNSILSIEASLILNNEEL